MKTFQNQLKAKMDRLERIEKAVFSPGQVLPPGMSYDERVLNLLERVVVHVGVVEQAHNVLAHAVRMSQKPQELGGE